MSRREHATRRSKGRSRATGLKNHQLATALRYRAPRCRVGYGAHAFADDLGRVLTLPQLPQDVLQDAAVLVVERFLRRVDAQDGVELGDGAVLMLGAHRDLLSWLPALDRIVQAGDLENLFARQTVRFRSFFGKELQRQ